MIDRKNIIILTIIVVLYTAFLFYVSYQSPYYLVPDDANHVQESYLLSQGNIQYAVRNWTRPLYAIPCATLITLFGYSLQSCRLIEIFSTIGTIILLYLIIYHFTKSKMFAMSGVVLFGMIPMVIVLATSNFAEPLFAFILLLGIYFLIREKWALSAITIGLLPLVRTEGFLMIAAWIVYYMSLRLFVYEEKTRSGVKVKIKGIHLKETANHPHIAFIIALILLPTIIWCIASLFILGNIFNPFQTYSLQVFKETEIFIPLWFVPVRIAYCIGILTSALFILAMIRLRKIPDTVRFAAYIALGFIIILSVSAEFRFLGQGMAEHAMIIAPLLILTGILSITTLPFKKRTLIILCIIIILAQGIELYSWSIGHNTDITKWPGILNGPTGHNREIIRGNSSPEWFIGESYNKLTLFYDKTIPQNETIQLCYITIMTNYANQYPKYRIIHTINDVETRRLCPMCVPSCDFTNSEWIVRHKGIPLDLSDAIKARYAIVYDSEMTQVLKKNDEEFEPVFNNLTFINFSQKGTYVNFRNETISFRQSNSTSFAITVPRSFVGKTMVISGSPFYCFRNKTYADIRVNGNPIKVFPYEIYLNSTTVMFSSPNPMMPAFCEPITENPSKQNTDTREIAFTINNNTVLLK